MTKHFSFNSLDLSWQNALDKSRLIDSFRKLITSLINYSRLLPGAKTIGRILEHLSFFLTALLFIALPLPQFAKDKEGLASIVIVAFIFWSIAIFLGEKVQRPVQIIDALVLLFFAINIVATCASHYLSSSIHGLLKLFVYVLAYFLFSSQLVNRPSRQLCLVLILLISGCIISLYGLYQYKIGVEPLATWEDPGIENQVTRIYATFNNPNLLAGYLLPIDMIAAAIAFTGLINKRWFSSLVAVSVYALLTLALVLTGSRGAYLGIAAGFACTLILGGTVAWRQSKGTKWSLLLFAFLLLIIIFVGIHKLPGIEQRIVSIFAGREHSSNSFRLNVWLSCLSMLKDNWLIGIGVGNQVFRLAYGLYMRSGFDALAAYSVPLELAVESGIFGLICFLLIVITALYKAHVAFWTQMENIFPFSRQNSLPILEITYQSIPLAIALALIAVSVHGLVDTVFFRPQVQFIFFILLSLLVSFRTVKRDLYTDNSRVN